MQSKLSEINWLVHFPIFFIYILFLLARLIDIFTFLLLFKNLTKHPKTRQFLETCFERTIQWSEYRTHQNEGGNKMTNLQKRKKKIPAADIVFVPVSLTLNNKTDCEHVTVTNIIKPIMRFHCKFVNRLTFPERFL